MHKNKTLHWLLQVFILLLLITLLLASLEFIPRKTSHFVLLSFDVEPIDGTDSVLSVVDVLKKTNTNTTFFVTGEYAELYPEIIKQLSEFELASHSYSHTKLTKLGKAEKMQEILSSRNLLEKISGKEIIGFRAPYNRLDLETIEILDSANFVYDASFIHCWSFFFPSLSQTSIGELPVSCFLGVPLEDVVFLHYLKTPKIFFSILKHKNSEISSYLFHPHHIAKHPEELEELITSLKARNVTFISHSQLIRS